MSLNPAHSNVYSIQLYMIHFCQRLAAGRCISPSIPVSPNNKADRHDDKTETLLKLKVEDSNATYRDNLL